MMHPKNLATVLLMVSAACSGSDREATAPPGTGPGPGGPTLATVSVHVGVAAEDAALASGLGWQSGVPGATVHFLRNGTALWKTAVTDASGIAAFQNVLPGLYRLYADRTLTSGEAQAIGEPVRAFGDGQTLTIGVGEVSIDLSLLADRPPGLLISEISQWVPPVQETGLTQYNEALFFEVYNNSDQTIFLDGKTFGASFHTAETLPTPCAQSEMARTDPGGVYTREVLAFPGTGGQFPIAPGEAKVIPIAAIDHTGVHPQLFDLSGSAFEIRGAGSADNPAVPDMQDVGLAPFVVSASGISVTVLFSGKRVFFLAESFDPQALPILYRDASGRGYVRVPADRILDAVSLTISWPDNDRDFPPCAPTVHPAFDRYEGGYLSIADGDPPPLSNQRRILRLDGHSILQDTNTSAVDIVLLQPTPGTLPPP